MFNFKQIYFQHSVWFSNKHLFYDWFIPQANRIKAKQILKTFPSKQDCVLFDENDGMTDTYNEL